MKSNKTIWVNPVQRVSLQGRHKQSYVIMGGEGVVQTRPMNKTKEFGTVSEYQFLPNRNNNKLQTGLEKLILNPYKDFTTSEILSKYGLPQTWLAHLEKIINQEQISLQTDMEIRHAVDPDYYTNSVKYTMGRMPINMADFGKGRSFLQDLKVILYPRPNEFSTSSPRQELLIKIIENNPHIAKNKEFANSSLHDWYISEENEDEVATIKKQERIEEGVYHLHKLKNENSSFRAYQLAILLRDRHNNTLAIGSLTDKAVRAILSTYVNSKDSHQLENIKRFMELNEMIYDKKSVDRFDIMYLIQQGVNTNIISRRDGQYVWHSKAGTPDVYKLGTDRTKLINFFLQEYVNYNGESDVTNWYKDLYAEVKSKGIKLHD